MTRWQLTKAEAINEAVRIARQYNEQVAVCDCWDEGYEPLLYALCVDGIDDIVAVVSPDGDVEYCYA